MARMTGETGSDEWFRAKVVAVLQSIRPYELMPPRPAPMARPLRPDPKRPRGQGKPYPGADGIFVDNEGGLWQALKIQGSGTRPTYYMCWDCDGHDPGGSFLDGDGVYFQWLW